MRQRLRAELRRRYHTMRSRVRHNALILSYHRICDTDLNPWDLCVSPRHFAEHLDALSRFGQATSLQELVTGIAHGSVTRRSFAITFDDGYRDNLTEAKPLLDQFDMPATVFITTGLLEDSGEPWWDELSRLVLNMPTVPDDIVLPIVGRVSASHSRQQDATSAERALQTWRAWKPPQNQQQALFQAIWERIQPLLSEDQASVLDALRQRTGIAGNTASCRTMLSRDDVLTLTSSGRIEVGAHTVSHPALAALPIPAQWSEIADSKKDLEALLERPIEAFAYPFGRHVDYSLETADLVRQAGFSCACSNFAGVVTRATDRYQLPRIHVGDWDGETLSRQIVRWFAA